MSKDMRERIGCESIKREVIKIFAEVFASPDYLDRLGQRKKKDHSIVTKIDLDISNIVKENIGREDRTNAYSFFSEEDQEAFEFPCIVLDPIDGTREMVQGIAECALSLAKIEKKGAAKADWGWIFNPFTGFDLSSSDPFHPAPHHHESKLVGLVSRTEWKRGAFDGHQSKSYNLIPKGSIAYKLGLLASGACDFVVSMSPKNIWDIAGGTVLCRQRGINFYPQGNCTGHLSEKKYQGPILWAQKRHFEELSHYFF